jgi:hypothetical protein
MLYTTTTMAAIVSAFSSIISALDNHTPTQYGENAHKEHGWSHEFQESILQLSFQLTRTTDSATHKNLGNKYYDLINNVFNTPTYTKQKRVEYISILYKMMLQTRDMIAGKGEYTLFYVLLGEWVRFANTTTTTKTKPQEITEILIEKAITSLIQLENFDHPYGSWKDFKYLLNYLRDHVATEEQRQEKTYTEWPTFKFIVQFLTYKLREETLKDTNTESLSLISKWLPRESSNKFGWQTPYIAYDYFNSWIKTAKTEEKQAAAKRKCLTHFRKLIADYNHKLKTIQINQCAKDWSGIDFSKQATSITIARQKKAFQYITKAGKLRGDNSDRLKCKSNFEAYVESCKNGERSIKGNRVGINELVKEAINISRNGMSSTTDVDTVNLQWREQSKQMGSLGNFIAMVDTSGSMECDNGTPLQAAIGLGCRVAEHSKLGKRVLTFSASPSWVNLDDCPDLTQMVEKLLKADWGMNTNFVSAIRLIISACVENDLPPEEVKNLTLIIFSDMQIDQADGNSNSMYETIKMMFKEGGMRTSHKRPYDPAHLVFWNLRSTSGFPALSTQQNVSMLSGFSPALLNSFCEKGMEAFDNCTPWNIFLDSLNNKRYEWTTSVINDEFITY